MGTPPRIHVREHAGGGLRAALDHLPRGCPSQREAVRFEAHSFIVILKLADIIRSVRNTFCMCSEESNRREVLAAGGLAVVVMYAIACSHDGRASNTDDHHDWIATFTTVVADSVIMYANSATADSNLHSECAALLSRLCGKPRSHCAVR